jgi:hypothetical protein
MRNLKLRDYTRNRVDKLDAVTTGVSIERRHKEFLEHHGVNLSALIRDVLDSLIEESERETKGNSNGQK